MYYVPDGTKKCGYYECKKCGNRFLSLQTMEKIPCPDCEAEIEYEIGQMKVLEDIQILAQLLQKIEGEERNRKDGCFTKPCYHGWRLQLDLKMYFLKDSGTLDFWVFLDCCNN